MGKYLSGSRPGLGKPGAAAFRGEVFMRAITIVVLCFLLAACSKLPQMERAGMTTEEADQQFRDRQYGLAAVNYRRAIEMSRPGAERERLIMQLASCFYNDTVQSLFDAESVYRDYLTEYPQGYYVQEARQSLERIRAIQANRLHSQDERIRAAEMDEAQLRGLLEESPYDAQLHVQLGNALWAQKRYDEACQAYLRSMEINAWLEQHEVIRSRVGRNAQGEAIALTPDLLREREVTEQPLVITDLHEYLSRQNRGENTAEKVFYNVQGLLRNRGPKRLHYVEVEVRFYNAGNDLLDVQRVRLGTMPPGAIRGFEVRGRNYDNIHNITRYECIPQYEV